MWKSNAFCPSYIIKITENACRTDRICFPYLADPFSVGFQLFGLCQLNLCKLPEPSVGVRAGLGCPAQHTEFWAPDVSRCGVPVPASPAAGQGHIPPCWDAKVWQEPPWGSSKSLHKICSDTAASRAWEIIARANCAYFAFSINMLVCFFSFTGIFASKENLLKVQNLCW